MNIDPIELLRERCRLSTAKEVAAELGLSTPYLSMVMSRKKPPSKRILEPLGLRRVVRYERVEQEG